MNTGAGVAQLVSGAVAHELANQMQPLLTALRMAGAAEPAQRAELLEMALGAVVETLALADELRRTSAPRTPSTPTPLVEVVELVLQSLPAELSARIHAGPPEPRSLALDAGSAVPALVLLIRHAAAVAGPSGSVQLELGTPLVLRFGGPSPSRDDASAVRPLVGAGRAELRLTPHLAMALMICAERWGEQALRVAHGDRSGRIELWTGGDA